MKLTKVGLFGVVLLAGCFPKPSERFECNDTSDCRDGRTCDTSVGYCVTMGNDGGSGSDGPPMDGEDPCKTFGSRHFDACALPRPTMPMTMTTAGVYTFDTTNGTLLDTVAGTTTPPSVVLGDARVISVESFSLGAGVTLRVNGPYPLVVASWGTIEVSGTIDASSTQLVRGAGSNPTTFCNAHLATPGTNNNGGGGAGGGSLQSAGGPGGDGGDGAANGGNGGTAAGTPAPLISGGCSGAKGGDSGGDPGGTGGLGGGGIQLTSRVSISIAATGKINVGGAGGKQSTGAEGGGGGGGAGGMVGFEAPSLTVTPGAIIAANGGGGGQGGGNNGGTATAGQDATLAKCTGTTCTIAAGGQGGSGGEGGNGSISATAAITGQTDGAGGGGGGGGAGYITIKATTRNDTGATYSPAPLVVQ